MVSLSEMKRKNKSAGRHFFDRGNSPVVSKQGNYLVTKGFGDGYVVYKYNPSNGHVDFVDNPYGDYSTQPHKTRMGAINYAKKLNGGKK